MDDLVGAAEIAERLDVAHPQTIHLWRRRHADFPKPIATLKTANGKQGAMIWNWPEVQAWAEATGHPRATERE